MARSMQFVVVLLFVAVWVANAARSNGASGGSGGASKKGGRQRKNGSGYVNQNNQVVCLSGGIPVCATDNSENYYFENECFFNAYNAKKSPYGSSSALTKIESSNCLKNCDYIYCDASYEPVCGFQPSTGTKQTFTNKCELNRATCFTMSQWVVQNLGPCQQAYNTDGNYQQSSQSSKKTQGSKKTSSSSSSYASPSAKYAQPSQNAYKSPMSYSSPMSPSKTYGSSPSYSAPSAQVKIPQQTYQSPAPYVPKPTYSRPSSTYSSPSQSQQRPYMSPMAHSTQMTSSLSSSYGSPATSSSYSVQSPQTPYMSPMAYGTQMTSSPSSPYAAPAAYQSPAKAYASPSTNYGSSSPAASYASPMSTGSYPAASSTTGNSYGATSSNTSYTTAAMNTTCPLGNNTVCASMNGVNQTFSDPCAVIAASYADGSYGSYETWVVIAQGECENATEICDLGNNTVCASLGGTNQTFANPCGVRDANYEIVNGNADDSYSSYSVGSYGSYETWIVIAQGECENATVVCELGNNTVCASLGGTNQTFANPCEVRDANNLLANGNDVAGYGYDSYTSYSADSYGSNDTWIVLAQGECQVPPVPCILGNNAVCAERNGTTQTFANPCEVETANANITDGTLWIVIQQGSCSDDDDDTTTPEITTTTEVTTTEEITTTTEVTTTEEVTTTTEVTTTEEVTTTTEVTTTEEVTTTTEVTTTEEVTTTTEATTTEEVTTTTEATTTTEVTTTETTTEEATTAETTTEDTGAGDQAGISVQVNIRPRRQLPDFSDFFERLSSLVPSFITDLFTRPSLQTPDSIMSSLMNTAMDFPPDFSQLALPSFFGSPIEEQEATTAPAMSWWEIKASTQQASTTPPTPAPSTPTPTPSTPAPTIPAATAAIPAPTSPTNTVDMSNFMVNFNQVLARLSSLIELSSSSSTQTPSTTTTAPPPTTTTTTTAAPLPIVFVSGDRTSDLFRSIQGLASPVAESSAATLKPVNATDCSTTNTTSAATPAATPAATITTTSMRQPGIADASAPVDITQNMITLPSKTNSNVRIVLHLPK